MRFTDARRIVSYLSALGISDLYVSPLFKATKGSPHGYDVTDHGKLNPDLGRESEFQLLVSALQQREMGLLLDVVPNHMGVATDNNRYWQDVLENGPSSRYATFFDIDWKPPKPELENKVLLPILGDQYGKVLESGDLRVVEERGSFALSIYGRRLQLAPRSWARILEAVLERIAPLLPPEQEHRLELESILTALRHLPPRTEKSVEGLRERRREKEVVKRRLAALLHGSEVVRRILRDVLGELNGRPGEPRSFDTLESLLADQPYRLCYWRVAADEINYRRFFDINDLAAIRVEEPQVFVTVHDLVFRLVGTGAVTGLRVDHPDGLYDPEGYFHALQAGCEQALATGGTRRRSSRASKAKATPAPFGTEGRGTYVVAEKILGDDEELSPEWAVYGTTGYDFLNDLNGIFLERHNAQEFHDLYARFTGIDASVTDLVYEGKRLVLDVAMSAELHMLARRLDRISEQHRWSRDFTLFSQQTALREIISCFPVYRSYTRPGEGETSEIDRRHIEHAIRQAKRRNPSISESLFDFLASVLLLRHPDDLTEDEKIARRDFVLRFQQITAPVTAKGVEDTSFYRFFPLVSVNEVGGELERFGLPIAEFHRRNAQRALHWPHTLLATSTHDTKRSEDLRARLDVLSEMPQEWEATIRRWNESNRRHLRAVDGVPAPDPNTEYLLYQTLVGSWPLASPAGTSLDVYVKRILQYMLKAMREAKVTTSWVNPSREHEEAMDAFVAALLEPRPDNAFREDLETFVERIATAGASNALAQVVLKTICPGVPDFYQGTEIWNFTLVDPDNRQPVNYEACAKMLEALDHDEPNAPQRFVAQLVSGWKDGRIKLHVTRRSLQLRRRMHSTFLSGEYLPLVASGTRRRHVCAILRRHESSWVLAAVPRLILGLSPNGFALGDGVWGDTLLQLPHNAPDVWRDVYTGRTIETHRDPTAAVVRLADLFASFPVALLEAVPTPAHPSG